MDPFALLSLTIVTAALLAWTNDRWVRLPTTIGVMAIALAMSVGLFVLEALGLHLHGPVRELVAELDLGPSLLDVMLAIPKSAGAPGSLETRIAGESLFNDGVGGTLAFLRRRRPFSPRAVKSLTWGGLRGGISIALALVLPMSLPERDLLLTVTYLVAVFSIGVQGLTIGPLIRRTLRAGRTAARGSTG